MVADSSRIEPKRVQLAFGQRIRQLRREHNLSQEELAARCGLHRTYLSSLERGERNVSLVNIHRLAAGMGLPVADLFHGAR
jgi:transcriptional regulator with XRE-family HTH domain